MVGLNPHNIFVNFNRDTTSPVIIKNVVWPRASQAGDRDPARGRITNFRGRRENTNFTQSIAYYAMA